MTISFAFLKMINVSFSTIDGKQSLKISVFATERTYLFLPLFLNHQSPVV